MRRPSPATLSQYPIIVLAAILMSGQGERGSSGRLNHDADAGPAFRSIGHVNCSAVRQCHLTGEAQANAASASVRRVERQENVLTPILGNSGDLANQHR